ncbi:MAG: hypothetical protein OK422_00610 [Thaumarchaeota archaeon]|nr:hypothetical protein [Nitrososphaerota archaeon]
MVTEYEAMIAKMIEEKKAKLAELKGIRGKKKEVVSLKSDIRFLEVELQRYEQSMSLFRTKGIPKVGRWGKPEGEGATGEKAG